MSRSFRRSCCSRAALLAICCSTVTAGPVLSRSEGSSDLVAPVSLAPSGNWEGIDGSWSSFMVRLGTPAQLSQLFVSWASHQTLVVLPQGCNAASDYTACESDRGGIFTPSKSSTWEEIGLYVLNVDTALGYDGNAEFGYDTLRLEGSTRAGPTLNHTAIGAFAVENFYLGLLGLNPQASNFTSSNAASPSMMTLLKERDLIPSISFGYTAGARYRQSGVLGSLTLGGYDSARVVDNNVQFDLTANGGSNTVVAVTSISTESQVQSNPIPVGLLPSTIAVSLDASIPQIWLPVEVCKAFETEFGLLYDNATNLYLVNNTLHASLLQRNPNITFELAPLGSKQNTVSITLPYAAFDLTVQSPYPGISQSSKYFPLRRAVNSSQYTFGRTFFQEAYITVDYESNIFNVSSIAWSTAAQEKLVTIPPSSSATSTTSASSNSWSGLSTGEKAGIITGGIAGVVLLALLAIFIFYICNGKHRKQPTEHLLGSDSDSTPQVSEKSGGSPETEIAVPPKAITDTATSTRRSSYRFDKRAALPSISEYGGGAGGAGGTPSTTRSASIRRSSGAIPPTRSSMPNRGTDSEVSPSRAPHEGPTAEQVARNRALTLSTLVAKAQPTAATSAARGNNHPTQVYEMQGDVPPARRFSVNGADMEPEQAIRRNSQMAESAAAAGDTSTLFSRPDSIEVTRMRNSQQSSTTGDATELNPSTAVVVSGEYPVSPISPIADRQSKPSLVRSFSFEE